MISKFVILLKQKRHWGPFENLMRDPMLRVEVCKKEKFLLTEAQQKIWRAQSSGIPCVRYLIFMK